MLGGKCYRHGAALWLGENMTDRRWVFFAAVLHHYQAEDKGRGSLNQKPNVAASPPPLVVGSQRPINAHRLQGFLPAGYNTHSLQPAAGRVVKGAIRHHKNDEHTRR